MYVSNWGMDFALNGRNSEFGDAFASVGFDEGYLRPYLNERGRPCVSLKTGKILPKKDESGKHVANALGEPQYFEEREEVFISDVFLKNGLITTAMVSNASYLPRDAWVKLDMAVGRGARQPLIAYSDLASQVPYGGFDVMGVKTIEDQQYSTAGIAMIDMDGAGDAQADRMLTVPRSLPLPLIYCDFVFTQRESAVSANRGVPLDTTHAEEAARTCGEAVEDLTLGTVTGPVFGTNSAFDLASQVFGYTNYTNRVTKADMTAPTGSNGSTILNDWLALIQALRDQYFYGPFTFYVSSDYWQYLNMRYSSTEPSAGTLKDVLMAISDVKDIKVTPRLTNTFTVIAVQMTPDVVQAVTGMDFKTIKWESKGGLVTNYRVIGCQVPRMRSKYDGKCGFAVGTTA